MNYEMFFKLSGGSSPRPDREGQPFPRRTYIFRHFVIQRKIYEIIYSSADL